MGFNNAGFIKDTILAHDDYDNRMELCPLFV